jgi:hypothetical protein
MKHDIELRCVPINLFHMIVGKLPENAIDEINHYIDNNIIPNNETYSDNLVGQINQEKKSAQLVFPLDTEYGKSFKGMLDSCATSLLENGFKREGKAEACSAWTIHSYAGDYNPFHSHGTTAPAGLSCIIYLKVPDCIKKLPPAPDLMNASGDCDGYTQLVYSTDTTFDLYCLQQAGQEMIKPEVGKILIFPKWVNHLVYPFFGEGERRTFSANFNVYYNAEENKKYGIKEPYKVEEWKYNNKNEN